MTTTSPSLRHSADSEITDRLIEAVAAEAGTDPMALDRPLYEVIDADALNALFSGSKRPDSVTFGYLGYRIEVHGTGRIDVTDGDQPTA